MNLLTTQLVHLGVSVNEATDLAAQIETCLKMLAPEDCWADIVKNRLTSPTQPRYPFAIHELLYKTIYPNWSKLPAPAWFGSSALAEASNLTTVIQSKSLLNYQTFHDWSVEQYPDFWQMMAQKLNIIFDKPYTNIVDLTAGITAPQWFKDAKLNITNTCFQDAATNIAIISQTEQGQIAKTTYLELDKLSNRIANSISHRFKKGDRLAIDMPMTVEAIAIYLGIIKAGCTVVSIADSFVADEIAVRLRISQAKAIFCQDYTIRDGKQLPLYEKITTALTQLNAIVAIVIPAKKNTETMSITLREIDLLWNDFLSDNTTFTTVSCDPNDYINILFSSGTTNEPKAIPWTQTTPLKCATDAYFHHNLKPNDVFCWPTNLGWMMGPWLIFACLLNKATIALYEGTPNRQEFGKFIQNTKVNILGVVPTIVKTWRNSGCMENLDWRTIKLFTSTGECSNTEDMLYLMYLADYRPIIEYCGGTEIGGAYITSTVLHPSAPGACTTPALGLDFVILNDQGVASKQGEVALIPPSIGLSTELLNKDHQQVYYTEMPTLPGGRTLRRHGDYIIEYPNGYYRLQGRSDDTMKLGGIKVSSAEIESVLNVLPFVFETAAIAIEPTGGGPSELIIYLVPKQEQLEGMDKFKLKTELQAAIKQHLNPLFKIHEMIIIDALPRTASNKIMRRLLRTQYKQYP